MCNDFIKTIPQFLVPHQIFSRFIGAVLQCKQPAFKNAFIHWFITRYGVAMNEAVEPLHHQYPDFNSFFTRRLRKNTRTFVSGPLQLACPVDGVVSQRGKILEDKIFQAKGHHFSLVELLGGSPHRAEPFRNGQFATFYLAPKDYHRVHMPLDGTLREMVYIPGRLFSVNPRTSRTIPNLFARNERVVAIFDTALGPVAIVLIGAMIVASIDTVWHGEVTPKHRRQLQVWEYPATGEKSVRLARGDEMGLFKLGSTVVVLFPPNVMQWADAITPDQSVKLGGEMAEMLNKKARSYSSGD